ncbi:MAG TPA: two-component regulator propeller domain-containing protein [Pyrinomonadaceae bacterium]|nr:two-component regulator propeller domain-containing protein [Pyrinomonadaceae bacterium]
MNLRRLSIILGVLASLPFSTRCVISASPSSPVDSERFIINAWRTDTGLPQATVNAIIQTRDGYLWPETYGGLVRFDGVKFTLFHSSNTQELKSIRIRALFEDREGNLWIGTEGGGLTRTRAGTFTTYTIEDGLPRNDVGGISQDREGYICVESGNVLVRLEQGRFVTYAPTTEHPLRAVTTPVEDLEGNIWFGTRAGLVRMTSRRQFKIYTIADGLPGDVIQSVLLARDGTLWIGTLNGLSHFASNEFTNYTTKEGLSSNYITCLTEDRSGKLWIGTFDAGANRFASGVFTQFTGKHPAG